MTEVTPALTWMNLAATAVSGAKKQVNMNLVRKQTVSHLCLTTHLKAPVDILNWSFVFLFDSENHTWPELFEDHYVDLDKGAF